MTAHVATGKQVKIDNRGIAVAHNERFGDNEDFRIWL